MKDGGVFLLHCAESMDSHEGSFLLGKLYGKENFHWINSE